MRCVRPGRVYGRRRSNKLREINPTISSLRPDRRNGLLPPHSSCRRYLEAQSLVTQVEQLLAGYSQVMSETQVDAASTTRRMDFFREGLTSLPEVYESLGQHMQAANVSALPPSTFSSRGILAATARGGVGCTSLLDGTFFLHGSQLKWLRWLPLAQVQRWQPC